MVSYASLSVSVTNYILTMTNSGKYSKFNGQMGKYIKIYRNLTNYRKITNNNKGVQGNI